MEGVNLVNKEAAKAGSNGCFGSCFQFLYPCGGRENGYKGSAKRRGVVQETLVCFAALTLIALMMTILGMVIRPVFDPKNGGTSTIAPSDEASSSTTDEAPTTSSPPSSSPVSSPKASSDSPSAPSSSTTSPPSQGSPNSGCSWDSHDLPRWVIPEAYRVELDFGMGVQSEMTGSVEIDLDVQTETDCIILNIGKNIDVQKVEVGTKQETGPQTYKEDTSQLFIKLSSALKQSTQTLRIEFESQMKHADNLILSKSVAVFEDKGGNTPTFLTTFGEAFGASSVFPCFDQSDMPATFELSMITPMDVTALTNTQPLSTMVVEGIKTKFLFDATPIIPSYMVAFASGDLSKATKIMRLREGQINVRLWSKDGEYGSDTLSILEVLLQEFESRFNQAYSLSKLDYIAAPVIPNGHGSHGLVYIADSDLYNKNGMDIKTFLRMTENLSSETARVWFGDLIWIKTPSEAYIKETLSTYFQYIGAEATFPGSGWFDRFYVQTSWPSIAIDDGEGPLPLTSEEHTYHNSLIRKNKGASLIRMLRTFLLQASDANGRTLGSDSLLDGIQDYFREFKGKDATIDDLWKIFSNISGDEIDKYMDHWTKTPGVPIVHVIKEGNDVFVKQSPLLTPKCDDSGAMWIPIRYKTKLQPEPRWKVLKVCGPELLVTLESPDDSAIVNVEGVGYFRSHYHWDILDSWLLPSSNILNPTLDSLDLAIFLSDALGCNEVGKYKMEVFMDFVFALGARQDTAFSPWKVALENLGKIRNLVQESDPGCTAKLSNYVISALTGPMLSILNDFQVDENDSVDYRLTRSTILGSALDFGDSARITEAKTIVSSSNAVHPDMFQIVHRAAILHGDDASYDQIMDKAIKENDVHKKKGLFASLIHTPSKDQIRKTWKLVQDGQYMDVREMLQDITSNKGVNVGNLFDVVIETYPDFKNKRGIAQSTVVSELLLELSRSLTSETKASALKALAEVHSELAQVSQEVTRIVSRNNEWVLKNKDPLCTWLDNA